MKKKILFAIILFLVLILSYIYYSNKKIDGIYIRNHSVLLNSKDSVEFVFPEQIILKISNQEFIKYQFGMKGIPDRSEYFSIGGVIKFEDDPNEFKLNEPLKIEKSSKKKLCLKSVNTKSNYIKIPDSLKSKPLDKLDFQNKVFTLKTTKYIDTLFFQEKFLMLKNRENENPELGEYGWETGGWEIINIDGFNILLSGYGSVFVLTKENQKKKFYLFENNGEITKIDIEEIHIDLESPKKIVEKIIRNEKR